MNKIGVKKTTKYWKDHGLFLILFVVFLFGSIVELLPNLTILTEIGCEDIYWERARFLAGQSGVSLYNGNSLYSLGYSFVLLPICIVIKSPYAAYKTAILLNSFFLCGSYYMSFITARKWFPRENAKSLLFVCFVIALCPIFAVERVFTHPVMIEIFLIWLSFYLMTELWDSFSCGKMISLAISLILIAFFNIVLIGVVCAVVLTLFFFMKKKKMDEISFSRFFLIVLVGVVAGNIIERIVLYFFFKSQELIPISSLDALLNCIKSRWNNGQVIELLKAVIGKMFAVITGSFWVICPGLYFAIKKEISARNTSQTNILDMVCKCVLMMFLIQIIIGSLCDNSGKKEIWWLSLRNIEVVLPPLLLLGLIEIKSGGINSKKLIGCLLFFCVCAYVTVSVFQKSGIISISKIYSSILAIFDNGKMQAVSLVYYAVCVMILVVGLLIGCWQVKVQKVWLQKILRIVGSIALVLVYYGASVKIYQETAIVSNQTMSMHVAPIASLVSETNGGCYYFKGTGNDNSIVVLQSLVPDHEIQVIDNNEQERDQFYADTKKQDGDIMLISGTGSSIYEEISENLPGYRLLYMTNYYALWADKDSDSCAIIEDGVERRLETPVLKTDAEEEISYSGSAPLPVGTYRLEVYLKQVQEMSRPAKQTGTLTVSDSTGKIRTISFDGTIFDEEGNGAAVIEFTGKNVMRNLEFKIEGEILPYLEVEKLYYWQLTPEFRIGQNQKEDIAEICYQVIQWDDICGTHGSVTYIEDVLGEDVRTSGACLEEFLPEREVTVLRREEVETVTSDYLIAVTGDHAYYQAMDEYSMIYRDNSYTVLVKNNTQQYLKAQELGVLRSEGTHLLMSAFEKTSKNYEKQVTLERGTYCYHFQALCNPVMFQGDTDEEVGILRLYNGTTLITEKTIYSRELIKGEIAVPFSLNAKAKKLKYEVEFDTVADVKIAQKSIELMYGKFQYGSNETAFTELTEIVNLLGGHTRLSVIQSENVIRTEICDYTYLQELVHECEVNVCTLSEVNASMEDGLIMVYDLTVDNMNLLSKYSILGHAGKYTLMARNDGVILAKAIELGIEVLNSGKKLSPASIECMSGMANEADAIGKLPSAKYKVTIELETAGLEADDTIELMLVCDKTEDEITAEIESLMEDGYTEKQAKVEVEEQMTCGSAAYDSYSFMENNRSIISVNTSVQRVLDNLTVEAYTWHGAEVKGKILWVELA